MSIRRDPGRIRAMIGPTVTGKADLAMDRMLGHATGMVSFPVRLLALDNHDRIVPCPRWFVRTVESIPLVPGEGRPPVRHRRPLTIP